MKADLHIHSNYSPDSIAKPESILAAAADRGIQLIAVTDHDTCDGWHAFEGLKNRYPVQIIYGQEIKIIKDESNAGELLCLFLKKFLKSTSVTDIVAEVASQNGVVSIAHPFSQRRTEFRGFCDIKVWNSLAIEVLNGRSYKQSDNEMARNLAHRLNCPITAGSDAHTPFEVGKCYLEFSGRTADDLKKAILNHQVQAVGNASSMLFSVLSGFGRFGLAI